MDGGLVGRGDHDCAFIDAELHLLRWHERKGDLRALARIKVAQEFVREIPDSLEHLEIIRAIAAMVPEQDRELYDLCLAVRGNGQRGEPGTLAHLHGHPSGTQPGKALARDQGVGIFQAGHDLAVIRVVGRKT